MDERMNRYQGAGAEAAQQMHPDDFAERLLALAVQEGISPAETALSRSESFSVRVREGKLEDYKVSDRLRLTLRGCWQGRIGTAGTQALDDQSLQMLIQGVKDSAELIETDEQDEILPPDEHYEQVTNSSDAVRAVTAGEKIDLAMEIDRLVMAADARLKPDAAVVASSEETFCLRNTLGLNLEHTSNVIYAYASALAREGDQAATGVKLLWGYSLGDVCAQKIAEGCAADALSKLGAGRMKSGTMPVVIENAAMADLLTTFSGVFSADNAQKGMSLLAGREGTRIAGQAVNLIDDPLMPMGMGSCPFDREGAATKTKNVIEGGVLRTLLHSRKTAKKAGVQTTGNAAGAGRVAPSNLYIVPSDASLDDLLRQMDSGLLVTQVSGLHAGANPVSGDFSLLARGYEVMGGVRVRAVEQITVAGNFYRLLEDITAVSNDLLFDGSPIGCPSASVRSLSIAGE